MRAIRAAAVPTRPRAREGASLRSPGAAEGDLGRPPRSAQSRRPFSCARRSCLSMDRDFPTHPV